MIVNTAHPKRRSEYEVGIGFGDDIDKAREVILQALRSVEGVEREPEPDVVPWELDSSSVNLKVRWWTESRRATVVAVRGRVIETVKRALNEAEIDIPFPTRVVLLHDQTEESDGDRRRQREGWPAGEHPPRPRHGDEIANGNEDRDASPQPARRHLGRSRH
jgi:small-conductance mechanosensitive channel